MEAVDILSHSAADAAILSETWENRSVFSDSDSFESQSYHEQIRRTVGNDIVFSALERKLKQLNIIDIEKRLGCGAFGCAFQVDGTGVFPCEKVALKVNEFVYARTVADSGDVNGLTVPEHKNLNRTYALLTYDGKEVYYVDKIDEAVHKDHIVIGHFSKAIQGASLGDFISDMHGERKKMSCEMIQDLGKQLISAVCALHEHRIVHNDLHIGNMFVEVDPDGQIKELVVGDFGESYKVDQYIKEVGLSKKKAESRDWTSVGYTDWRFVGYTFIGFEVITENMGTMESAFFCDLLFSRVYGLIRGEKPLQGQEVLSHPFFSNEKSKQNAEIIPIVIAPAPEPKKPVQLISISLKELKQKDFQLVGAHAKNKKAVRSIQWDVSRNVAVIEKNGKFRVYQIGAGGAPALFSHKKLSEVTKFLNVM